MTIDISAGDLIKSPGHSYKVLNGKFKNQDEFRLVLQICRLPYEDLVEIIWLICPSGEIKKDKYGKTATWESINFD
jgi:hypothetical protein